VIELVLASLCTGCGECVRVCPTQVFDAGANGVPVIARQEDCQTCFMCELYCQADALYVGPDHDHAKPVAADEILNSGLLGQYRRDSGWHEWAAYPEYASQFWRMSQVMNGGREVTAARKTRPPSG
jgi:NAD-dependent dihydropyrimidine dehydrogenase PreA subunit